MDTEQNNAGGSIGCVEVASSAEEVCKYHRVSKAKLRQIKLVSISSSEVVVLSLAAAPHLQGCPQYGLFETQQLPHSFHNLVQRP